MGWEWDLTGKEFEWDEARNFHRRAFVICCSFRRIVEMLLGLSLRFVVLTLQEKEDVFPIPLIGISKLGRERREVLVIGVGRRIEISRRAWRMLWISRLPCYQITSLARGACLGLLT